MSAIRSVAVFCGSSPGVSPRYAEAARELGERLARAGIRIVYGGGRVGLMGVLADAALAAGGEVVGVIPSFLHEREVAHAGITDLRVVPGMHERKKLMFDMVDAACALPGGLGTLDELVEFVTWRQLRLHRRKMVLVSVDGYWDDLDALVDRIVVHGFVEPAARDFFHYAATPREAVEALSEPAAPTRRENPSPP